MKVCLANLQRTLKWVPRSYLNINRGIYHVNAFSCSATWTHQIQHNKSLRLKYLYHLLLTAIAAVGFCLKKTAHTSPFIKIIHPHILVELNVVCLSFNIGSQQPNYKVESLNEGSTLLFYLIRWSFLPRDSEFQNTITSRAPISILTLTTRTWNKGTNVHS